MPSRTLIAIYKNGALQLAEAVALRDGDRVKVTIHADETGDEELRRAEVVRDAFGAWKGLIDADEFKRCLRESREIASRPAPQL
jgi:predicted DNA-binding antitoxin AbrB/MazE fold protein